MTEYEQLAPVLAFVRALREAGVMHVCVSPGSRSAPLTIAAAREPGMEIWNLPDERSAGFFALGLARVTEGPVALVCTSGTAAANYLPAVVEAFHGRVALLLLTADRPPELHEVGANQTIRQSSLYGASVKWSLDMPVPSREPSLSAHAAAAAVRAAAVAMAAPRGPVHVNYPFREPLIPGRRPAPQRGEAEAPTDAPPESPRAPAVRLGTRRLSRGDIAAVASGLDGVVRGVVVCGPLYDAMAARAIARLAERLGYPLLADPLSQLRSTDVSGAVVIDQYDTFLRFVGGPPPSGRAGVGPATADDPAADDAATGAPTTDDLASGGNEGGRAGDGMDAWRPEIILRFGQAPTSKTLGTWLSRQVFARQYVVDESEVWRDPQLMATDALIADARELCEDLLAQLGDRGRGAPAAGSGQSAWLARWQTVNRATLQAVGAHLAGRRGDVDLFEGEVWRELSGLLPDGSVLVVGNSMAVRDADAFFPATARSVRIIGNRGASGIDGVVSTALGAAAAQRRDKGGLTALVIGDLSFYHDLNGLLAAATYGLQLLVVLIHNDGGGIFSFLPPAGEADVFPHFAAAHGLEFARAVHMYGGRYRRIAATGDVRAAVQRGLQTGGLCVLELPSDRGINVTLHARLLAAVEEALRGAPGEPGGSLA